MTPGPPARTAVGRALDRTLPLPRARRAFRTWRRTRPFWAGVLSFAAGAEMIWVPLAPLGVMIHMGVGGMSALGIGMILMAAALFYWFKPDQCQFVAVMGAVAPAARAAQAV